jgi:hypothetical protein
MHDDLGVRNVRDGRVIRVAPAPVAVIGLSIRDGILCGLRSSRPSVIRRADRDGIG